ncbi:MAG: alanine racemase [Gemmatimonadales bacterium]|nr:alanine racemase [Gemmatimonadales bacterium]
MTKSIRAWVEIDLAAIVQNARRFQQVAGVPLLPMVKADAYGLGATAVVRALESVDPWGYGVATSDEGAALRTAGIDRPIVVFTPLQAADVAELRTHRLRPVIGDLAALEAWTVESGDPFHIEIDTGMSRAGFRWHDEESISALAERLPGLPGWEGIFTHFHSADSDDHSTEEQLQRFDEVLTQIGARPKFVHMASSAAVELPGDLGGDLARPGIFLYGGKAGKLEPLPVAKLCGRVVALRRLRAGDTVSYGAEALVEVDTTIATIGIGYADGVPRSLGNRGLVELGGVVVPIVGRVTMDMIMVDAEDIEVSLGDVATLFGGLVTLDDQAALAGTISYELLTMLSPRVERRYAGEEGRGKREEGRGKIRRIASSE